MLPLIFWTSLVYHFEERSNKCISNTPFKGYLIPLLNDLAVIFINSLMAPSTDEKTSFSFSSGSKMNQSNYTQWNESITV